MREVRFLSPSAISIYNKDKEEFYLRYLADKRPPRPPQTKPMSIGAAFDAYIKAHLAKKLLVEVPNNLKFKQIFETQVELHNRPWALIHGKYVFDCYIKSGALAALMLELDTRVGDPQFEFTLQGTITTETCIEGVPFLGKPDLKFVTAGGDILVYDWKVNGYCSRSATSPKRGYLSCNDSWQVHENGVKQTRGNGNPHKDTIATMCRGITLDCAHYMEDIDQSWATQLAIYTWMLGAPIGTKAIIGIDQLCCKPHPKANDGHNPLIRVARFRARISEDFQKKVFNDAVECWNVIHSGHIFRDLSEAESYKKQQELDRVNEAYEHREGEKPEDREWMNAMMQSTRDRMF
jgi:hypothetical protein